MAKFKSNSICEALAYNLSKEELTKLGYDGYEAFDSLQCREGYKLLSQPTVNLLSDEKYSTANIYAKNFGEDTLAVSDIKTKLDMYKQEEKDNYSNLITNRYCSCQFPFSFNSSQQGFASIPLIASSSSSYTFMYNGAVVPVMVKSDVSKSLNLPYNHFEWFIGSETNIEDRSINKAVNDVIKRLIDTVTAVGTNFVLQDIRITPQNFIMTRTEFINNYEQLHNLITDDSIGIIVDDTVDKTAFQTALTTWDELDDTQKTIDKFFTDIQNKYKYWIYYKCSPLILIPATATYLDIDKRTKTGLDYPTTVGYLDVSKMDFTKIYNNRLGQAGFHPRFLTKLLYGQVVQIPMNGTPPVIETYTEDIITLDKQILLDNEIATLTITLGKSTMNNVDYPNKMGDVVSDDPTKLVVTKVNDTTYTLTFTQNALEEDNANVKVTTKRTNDGTNYSNNHFTFSMLYGKKYIGIGDGDVIGPIGGSVGGGGGNGSTGQYPGGDLPKGPETAIKDDYDEGAAKRKQLVMYYNNSGVKGKADNSLFTIEITPFNYNIPGYKRLYINFNIYRDILNSEGVGEVNGILSKKHLFVHYNYMINQINIIEFDSSFKQSTYDKDLFEDYSYQEGDELKYNFMDIYSYGTNNTNDKIDKYVKRKHFSSSDTSPELPIKQGDNITLVDLKQLGDIIEVEESPNKKNIYLEVNNQRVLLGHYDPTLEQKVFETNYLPISWLTDEIPHINAEGINDEVKGMFFIPGNNWLNDPTDVTSPCWVQNPGIFGSLEGLVDIAGTTYKVSSLEENYYSLRDRTDKNFKITSDDLEKINVKTTPYTFGDCELLYVQDSDIIECSTTLDKFNSKLYVLKAIIIALDITINVDDNTVSYKYLPSLQGRFSHNPKNNSNFNVKAVEFNKNNPPSVPEYTYVYSGKLIKKGTYISNINVEIVSISTRLPYQELYNKRIDDSYYNKISEIKEV